jgi:hypothetical protein
MTTIDDTKGTSNDGWVQKVLYRAEVTYAPFTSDDYKTEKIVKIPLKTLTSIIQSEIDKAVVEELESLLAAKKQPGMYWGDIVLDTIHSHLSALTKAKGEG